jgi:hypothetical protein
MQNAIALLALLGAAWSGCAKEEPVREEAVVSDFRAGQVWTYETRKGEEASRVVVCRVEPDPKAGTIVHIRVEGLALKSPKAPDGVSRAIGHLPLSEQALRESVLALESTGETPSNYLEGYKIWKAAFDAGEGGIFTISVANCVELMERSLNR